MARAPRLASSTPFSLRSASNQPQKRFSWFQTLSPWRTITKRWAAAMFTDDASAELQGGMRWLGKARGPVSVLSAKMSPRCR
ncbi:hypothetical protein EYF80_055555 [Liparis tanakae]|uniref:Uncharacterized protein n=1 Tax=Liparis tanakae TaxID=230148 RepID=A0A4Z2F1C5_9TELE|nr:hypothetical protein EYF80_055555 [Liparis tanakae]